MYKNVTFAQGLVVLVPKQQLLISEFLKLTVSDTMQARQHEKNKKVDKNFEKPKVITKYCDGILNFEAGMMLSQNSWVFIVFGTVTPSVKKCRVVRKMVCNNIL